MIFNRKYNQSESGKDLPFQLRLLILRAITNQTLIKAVIFIFPALILINMTSCKKLVEVNPPITGIVQTNVYANDVTATAVLSGMYENMSQNGLLTPGSFSSMSFLPALSADELTLYSGSNTLNLIGYYNNKLSSNDNAGTGYGTEFWSQIYNNVFICNAAIEGLNGSNTLTATVKQQLLGEAMFMRAFSYFYLVNLYGDVPLILSTDYKANSKFARTPQPQVYDQIIKDLKQAQTLLSENYLDLSLQKTTGERVRPTKWAATALLARVYLFTKDYTDAATQASALISNSSQFSLTSLDNAFLANSNEAIWQIQNTSTVFNTNDAQTFIIPPTGLSDANPVYLSQYLLNAFESGDQRKSHWIAKFSDSTTTPATDYYYAFKYKVNAVNAPQSEYEMVFRLAEQYLIRAEAETNGAGGGPNAAMADLNIIRNRAGLPNYSGATDQTSLSAAILHERQVELFTEWGNRWLDLKRTNIIDGVMSVVTPQKGGTWSAYKQLYPLPVSDILKDPNLQQNSGY